MRSTKVTVVALGVALVWAAPAAAQTPVGSDDPAATSPPGTVYEIPLDTARRSGAPRPRAEAGDPGDTGAAQPAAPGAGSSVRSDNGFGSSSVVPGASTPAPAEDGGGAGDREPSRKSDRRPAASRERAADERKAASREAAAEAREAAIRPAAVQVSPSVPRVLVLMGLAAALAIGLGLAAWRASR